MKKIEYVKKVILRIVYTLTFLLFTVLICIVFAQVFWRYALQSPIFWAEEFARILYVWMIMLALVISMDEGSQASVDLLTKKLFCSRGGRISADLFVNMCMLLFSIVLVIYGFRLSHFVAEQVFPALDISYSVQYLAVPVSSTFLVLIFFTKILHTIFPVKATQE